METSIKRVETPKIDFGLFVNRYGMIRRCYAHSEYVGAASITSKDVVDVYQHWRDEPEYVMLRRTQYYEMSLDTIQKFPNVDYIFLKVPKRGNDVFRRNLEDRLSKYDNVQSMQYFNSGQHEAHTKMLFMTLTYDPSRCNEKSAWKNIGKEFNLFLSKIKQKFGEISYFRTWESYNSFYPHVHLLVHFKETNFRCTEHLDKNGNKSFRIPWAQKQLIESFWHSFVDIQGVQDVKNSLNYLHKYLTKDAWSDNGEKTQAMAWVHNKQTYALSHDFNKVAFVEDRDPWEDDRLADDLIVRILANSNTKYEFFGLIPGRVFKNDHKNYFFTMKHPPPRALEIAEIQLNEF